MNSFFSTRRLAATAGIAATIAMVTLGCSDNSQNERSGPDGTSTNSPVSSISSQLSSVISSVKPSN